MEHRVNKLHSSLFVSKAHLKISAMIFLVSFCYIPNTVQPQFSKLFRNDSIKISIEILYLP